MGLPLGALALVLMPKGKDLSTSAAFWCKGRPQADLGGKAAVRQLVEGLHRDVCSPHIIQIPPGVQAQV